LLPNTVGHINGSTYNMNLLGLVPSTRHLIVATIVLVTLIARHEPLAAQTIRLVNNESRVRYHPSPRVRIVPDIVFARYGSRLLRLDLYLPIGTNEAVPGVIVIRGGGWLVNDRAEFAPIASALAERGVAAASIEYRTADEAPYPGAVQDVKAAIRWMRANARLYGISPVAIGTLGGSSGAHMALLAGITNDRDLEGSGGNDSVSTSVQAVVAMAAPTDLSRLDGGGRRVVTQFLRASRAQKPELWAQASPMNHIRANGPSVLLIHSTTDESVLPEQSSRFAELYRKAGSPVELVLIQKAPHAFWNYVPWFEDTMNRAATFFHRVANQLSNAQDLSPFFKNTKGAFVIYDLKNNRYIRYNEARCGERFSPKSTFKIPNSLIGLETGVIRDADFVIAWDRQKHPPQDNWNQEPFSHWGQDQTLRSAIKYSVVWYYQELALRVGERSMKKYISIFNYGNQDVSGGIDEFWLNGKLTISADEQVEFLKAFYNERLAVSKRSTDIVKDILALEKTPTYTLSGKTGGGSIAEGKYIGWFVGYLETKGDVYFFATNIEGSSFPEIRVKRVDVTKQILMQLGYLPK
jgi:beta-lactamase class D